MKNFKDFDDFLQSQELKKQTEETVFRLHIKKNHADLQPFLSQTVRLFDEFNTTIIQPRKSHFIVLKKHEFLDHLDEKAFFIYRINSLPRNLFANNFNPYTATGAQYILPTTITPNDWYLKVSLQLDVILRQSSAYENILTPHIVFRVWGRIPSGPLIPAHLNVGLAEEWGKIYTTLSYQVSTPQDPIWHERFKEALILVTPAIFSHNKEVYGIQV